MDSRHRLLQEWATYLTGAARQGAIPAITAIEGIAGPRAGALEISAGLEAGKLLRAFSQNDKATLRQFVPWPFSGDPQCYMAGRYVRVEAAWPDHLAETLIRLGQMGHYPRNGGKWIAGKNEYGQTIRPQLDDATPHFLVSGATGSGKSVALRSAVLQLSQDPANELVLIDGKYGESLAQVAHLRGVVGPVAVDGPGVRAALGWACAEMRRRYETGNKAGRVVVVFDEFQEFVSDDATVGLLKRIAAQGRAAHVHLLAATQHPTVDAFGDASTRRNLTGKLALKVGDPDASRVAVGGSTPRADYLLGAGDCYAVKPGAVHRVQMAYVDQADFERAEAGGPLFTDWPEYDAGQVGQELPTDKAGWSYSGPELAVSLVSAAEGEGRPAMVRRLDAAGLGHPGAERAIRLLALGREAHGWLENHGFYIGQ
ncbi:MAG: FtsK/SpoIIIE domain-containing protein [Chloroflexota bacterium]